MYGARGAPVARVAIDLAGSCHRTRPALHVGDVEHPDRRNWVRALPSAEKLVDGVPIKQVFRRQKSVEKERPHTIPVGVENGKQHPHNPSVGVPVKRAVIAEFAIVAAERNCAKQPVDSLRIVVVGRELDQSARQVGTGRTPLQRKRQQRPRPAEEIGDVGLR